MARSFGRPLCPNHGEPLEIDASNIGKKGMAPCPVSKVMFDYEADLSEEGKAYDKFGNPMKTYEITGND